MEAATESEVPKGIRREIRAVLLSKQGGVPLHTFLRDYQKLTDTRLDLREMGYSSIRAFIGAIPDTARIQYDSKHRCEKVFGIGDPSTYMSMSAKRAQGFGLLETCHPPPVHSDDLDDSYSTLIPNDRGIYSVTYKRNGIYPDTKPDIIEMFSNIADLESVNVTETRVFIRFRTREEAVRILNAYGDEMDIEPANQAPSEKVAKPKTSINTYNLDQWHCFNCGEQGHQSKECQNQRVKMCYNCGKKDHHSKECKSEAMEGGAICFKCGKLGHLGEDCLQKGRHVPASSLGRGLLGDAPVDRFLISSPVMQQMAGHNYEIYIGNIPSACTDEEINEHFSEYDFVMIRIKRKELKVYAFITFTDVKEMNKFTAHKFDTWLGRRLIVKPGKQTQQLYDSQEKTNYLINDACARIKEVNFDEIYAPRRKEVSMLNAEDVKNGFSSLRISVATSSPLSSPPMTSATSSPTKTTMSSVPYKQFNNLNIQVTNLPKRLEHSTDLVNTSPEVYRYVKATSEVIDPYSDFPDLVDCMPDLEGDDSDESLPGSVSQTDSGVGIGLDMTAAIFVCNFPHGTIEHDLQTLFMKYGSERVIIMNSCDKSKSTYAYVIMSNRESAERARADVDQTIYRGKQLLVGLDIKEPPSPQKVEDPQILTVYSSMLREHSMWSTVARRKTPGDKVLISTVIDEKHFFGQAFEDLLLLNKLHESMQKLDYTMRRKSDGVSRCGAYFEGEWYRAWIVSQLSNNQMKVFYVDYGNTATVSAEQTIDIHELWHLPPFARCYKIKDGTSFKMTEDMQLKLFKFQFHDSKVAGIVSEVTMLRDIQMFPEES